VNTATPTPGPTAVTEALPSSTTTVTATPAKNTVATTVGVPMQNSASSDSSSSNSSTHAPVPQLVAGETTFTSAVSANGDGSVADSLVLELNGEALIVVDDSTVGQSEGASAAGKQSSVVSHSNRNLYTKLHVVCV
jgi:hypothetical protein